MRPIATMMLLGVWMLMLMTTLPTFTDARLRFLGETPTYANSTQSLPLLTLLFEPDDNGATDLLVFEQFRYRNAELGRDEWYEVEITREYAEHDLRFRGVAATDVTRVDAITKSVDTLGLADQVDAVAGLSAAPRRRLLERKARRFTARQATPLRPDRHNAAQKRAWKRARSDVLDTREHACHAPIGSSSSSSSSHHSASRQRRQTQQTRRRLLADVRTCDELKAFENDGGEEAVAACKRAAVVRAALDKTASDLTTNTDVVARATAFYLQYTKSLNLTKNALDAVAKALDAAVCIDTVDAATAARIQRELAAMIALDGQGHAAVADVSGACDTLTSAIQNKTLLLAAEVLAASKLALAAGIADAHERAFIQHGFDVQQEMLTTAQASLTYMAQQTLVRDAALKHATKLSQAYMRADQTRRTETLQQNEALASIVAQGWRPWLLNAGQAPYMHLPTAWQVETMMFHDAYWADAATGGVYRDHVSLLCDAQNLVLVMRDAHVETFVDLLALFATRPCAGVACDCRVHRVRHVLTGVTASALAAYTGDDAYLATMRAWMQSGAWNTTLVMREPTPVPTPLAECSATGFNASVDAYLCPRAYTRDHVSLRTLPASAWTPEQRVGNLSTAHWTWDDAGEAWAQTLPEVQALLRDACMRDLHAALGAPATMRVVMANAFVYAFAMPEAPATRTYCDTALSSVVDAVSAGRPMLYFAMDYMVRGINAWHADSGADLEQLFDGYPAAPQVSDTRAFQYALLANDTVPSLVRQRTMYAAATTVDAQPVYALENRERHVQWVVRRMQTDATTGRPLGTGLYDAAFAPVRLDGNSVHAFESANRLNGVPQQMTWIGYAACATDPTCPLFVSDMSASADAPRIHGAVTRTGAPDDATGGVAASHIFDVDDAFVVLEKSASMLAHSATYTFMPLDDGAPASDGPASATYAVGRRNRAQPYPGVDGIARRFLAPTLGEWYATHTGVFDPRDIGLGPAAFMVRTNVGVHAHDVRCTTVGRPTTSPRCDLLDLAMMDFNVSRGTVRWYARNMRHVAQVPMASLGQAIEPPRTTCPDAIAFKFQPLQTGVLFLTAFVAPRAPGDYAYVLSTRCDDVTHGGFFAAAEAAASSPSPSPPPVENAAWMDVLIGAGVRASAFGADVGDWATLEEYDMSRWRSYATQSYAVASCNQQRVRVLASSRGSMRARLGAYLKGLTRGDNVDAYTDADVDALLQLRSGGDPVAVRPPFVDADAAAKANAWTFMLVHAASFVAHVFRGAADAVPPADAAISEGGGAAAWADRTPVLACRTIGVPVSRIDTTSVHANVATSVRYEQDQLAGALRDASLRTSAYRALTFDAVAQLIRNVWDVQSNEALRVLTLAVNASVAVQADATRNLTRHVLSVNGAYADNVARHAQFQALIAARTVPTADLAVKLAQARALLDEANRIRERDLDPALADFAAKRAAFADALGLLQARTHMFDAWGGTAFDEMGAHRSAPLFFTILNTTCPFDRAGMERMRAENDARAYAAAHPPPGDSAFVAWFKSFLAAVTIDIGGEYTGVRYMIWVAVGVSVVCARLQIDDAAGEFDAVVVVAEDDGGIDVDDVEVTTSTDTPAATTTTTTRDAVIAMQAALGPPPEQATPSQKDAKLRARAHASAVKFEKEAAPRRRAADLAARKKKEEEEEAAAATRKKAKGGASGGLLADLGRWTSYIVSVGMILVPLVMPALLLEQLTHRVRSRRRGLMCARACGYLILWAAMVPVWFYAVGLLLVALVALCRSSSTSTSTRTVETKTTNTSNTPE
jgi:hypothetical protein